MMNQTAPKVRQKLSIGTLRVALPVSLYVPAGTDIDHAPTSNWAMLELTEERLQTLVTLQNIICDTPCLDEAHAFACLEWSGDNSDFGDGNDLRMEQQRLCVDDEEFWFRGTQRQFPNTVQTERFPIKHLLQILQGDDPPGASYCRVGSTLLMADDVDELESVLECDKRLPHGFLESAAA